MNKIVFTLLSVALALPAFASQDTTPRRSNRERYSGPVVKKVLPPYDAASKTYTISTPADLAAVPFTRSSVFAKFPNGWIFMAEFDAYKAEVHKFAGFELHFTQGNIDDTSFLQTFKHFAAQGNPDGALFGRSISVSFPASIAAMLGVNPDDKEALKTALGIQASETKWDIHLS